MQKLHFYAGHEQPDPPDPLAGQLDGTRCGGACWWVGGGDVKNKNHQTEFVKNKNESSMTIETSYWSEAFQSGLVILARQQ